MWYQTNEAKRLTEVATALYWGEGAKNPKYGTVDVANSDPALLKLFLKFLREVVTVDEKRIRIYLYCFSDQDVEELKTFWSEQLRVPTSQFLKPYVRPFDASRKRRMPYGVAHVRYNDKALLHKVLAEIEHLKTWAGSEAVKRE